MLVKRACLVLAAACLLGHSATSTAGALQGRVLLAFGDSYPRAEGGASTHRGIDVALAPGAPVDTPIGGQVRFAGRIPGPGGESILCVSVEGDEGIVTLMPLTDLVVSKGDALAAGDVVASLAPSGDPSSDQPHVHMGLKRNDVYLDPAVLLMVPAVTKPTEPSPARSPAEAPALAPTAPAATAVKTAPAPSAPSDARAPVTQPRPATAPSPSGATAPAPAASSVAAPAGEIAVVDQPGVSVPIIPANRHASSATRLALSVPAGLPAAAPAAGPILATKSAADFKAIGAPAIGALVAAVAAASMILTRRSLVRRATTTGPVSDRLGILLQHLKAGDTLCGLTSCSGPLPSQSRGH